MARVRPGRRLGALVLRDGLRALAGIVVPIVLALAWLQRSDPPPALRAAVLGLPPAHRAGVLVGIVAAIAVLGAPAVRTVIASRRLDPWRALPLGRGWWQSRLALHLVVIDTPWWIALGYGVAPFDRDTAMLLVLAGVGTIASVQVGIVALADRPWPLRIGGPAALLAIAWAAWALAPLAVAASLGAVSAIAAAIRLRRPWPEPRPPLGSRLRVHAPALAWARLLAIHWRRHAPNHLVGVLALQIGLLGVVAIAAGRDVSDGPWIALARGLAIAGTLAGAWGLLVAVRASDRHRGWFDATPLRSRDEAIGRAIVAAIGTGPTWLLGPVVAILGGAPTVRALEPIVVAAWAIAEVLAIVAGRECRFTLHEPAWRRFVVVLVLAEALALALGVVALLPWTAIAIARTRAVTNEVAARRQRFDTPTEDAHG